MTKAWLSAGYVTEEVDLENHKLVFRREGDSQKNRPDHSDKHPLYGVLAGTARVAEGYDLTSPADAVWDAAQE